MNLRGSPIDQILQAWTHAYSAGIAVDYLFLEAHFLVAGDPHDLIDGLIFAREHQLKLSPTNAAARQLVARFAEGRSLRESLADLKEAGYSDLDIAPVRPSLLASPE